MATPLSELELPTVEFDFADAEEHRNALLALSKESWIAKGVFAYPIFKYEDCVAILRDKRWHSAAALAAEAFGVNDPRLKERRRQSILSAEGDVHTRLRRLVAPSFSPRAADRLRPFMREVMNSLIDPVAKNGKCDLATDICDPYPIPIICELLGAPKKDWQLFSRWAEDVLRIFNATASEELDVIFKAQDELGAYTRQLITDRRSLPADDLITSLIAAEEAGDKLDEAELEMMVEAVIVGGTDTTRNQLGCSIALFAEHPEQWKLLAEQPELAGKAVEETMRYFGAVRATGRFASEDIEYKGVLFPKGTLVTPSLSIANRDETVFNDANIFDITREPAGQPQMTFGSGIHYCLGAALARAEQHEALPIMAQRMKNLRIDGAVTWKPSTVAIFGPENMPISFDPE
ncbi:MAG: cytochrome P450 [Actinomycetota bacterium]|nr:cytochrome P450 [Actinomycetota bacterium]MDA3019057.1 cytochrome P450 [Actinomycetota bacterium]